ncbi:hypothetical protein BOTBODRAFT_31218 [Botryobasidium botryosum FD-172 SS1]|uniref:Ubiquitin 3 binding protein But2 C-terminal domain-containing protein n=1 Tax=Botryobasidium botryosum (strain FD-172 SS1) TaxID=930990 RepID=A0A067MK43_BOTB1|nr:hypothetical protein BOTBODRAFT_31218 [Botryobasidium botryosum FD-172 SS1]
MSTRPHSSVNTESEYEPLTSHPDGEYVEPCNPIRAASDASTESRGDLLPYLTSNYLLWGSLLVVCLSIINTILLPFTLEAYANTPPSKAELDKLPYADAHLGLDLAAQLVSSAPTVHHAWPERIARVSRQFKDVVYGSGVQVVISNQESTIMQFRVPPHGTPSCALAFHAPPEHISRDIDVEIKGSVSEIEIWSIDTPEIHSNVPSKNHPLDFDALSWNSLPSRSARLGMLDLRPHSNFTTERFACPTGDMLTVEMRCPRADCHIKFAQVRNAIPKLGVELVRWHE